jgi:hypothetical protein
MSARHRRAGTNATQVLGMVDQVCSILTAQPR